MHVNYHTVKRIALVLLEDQAGMPHQISLIG